MASPVFDCMMIIAPSWYSDAVAAVISVPMLQRYGAVVAVVIVYDNCGVVAVDLGAGEALKHWAAGLLRLEGGCAALGSIIHWLLCILFWSETHIDIKGKMGEGRKTAHCLKKPMLHLCISLSGPGAEEMREQEERYREKDGADWD